MSISEIILFVASNSKASVPCIQFVSKNRIPIQIVRLDTEQARETAANGKFFQVTSVPTLTTFYEDGNVQLFTGTQKIIQWLTAMLKSNETGARERERPRQPREEVNMYGPSNGGARRSLVPPVRKHTIDEGHDLDFPGPSGGRKVSSRPQAPRIYVPEDDSPPEILEEEPELDANAEANEEPEPEPEPVRKPKTKPRKSTKADAKPKRKPRTKKEPVEEQEDLEFLDEDVDPRKIAREKLNAVASAKSKPPPSRMKSVYNLAKQMEQDRDSSLGYKEEDLPHF